jgi:hypothetical protein
MLRQPGAAMPIDINAILGPFVVPFRRQWLPITLAFAAIAERIRTQLDRAERIERSTRLYPTFDFPHGALAAAVSRTQAGQLGPPPPAVDLRSMIRQEWLIPEAVMRISGILSSIRGAITRFQTPDPSMFSLRGPGRFVDIFGHAAMILRPFVQDFRSIRRLVPPIRSIMSWYRRTFPERGPAPGTAPQGPTSSFGLANVPGALVGAILLIPAVMEWVSVLGREVALALRMRLLAAVTGIESFVFDMRTKILMTLLNEMRNIGQTAMEFLLVAGTILTSNLRYYGVFVSIYSFALIDTLSRFSSQLHDVVNTVLNIVNTVIEVINFILSIDLVPFLLGPVPYLLADFLDLEVPTFTIDDLITTLTDVAGIAVSAELLKFQAYLDAAQWIAGKLGMDGVQRRLRSVRDIIGGARSHVEFGAQPALPVIAPLPNLYALAIAPHLPTLRAALTTLRDETGLLVETVFARTAGLMDGLGNVFERASAAAARGGSPAVWRHIAESSDRMAHLAFGVQVEERRRLLARHPDLEAAEAFDRAFVQSGFEVLAGVIPRYVGGVVAWWRQRSEEIRRGELPTSQHIISEHARLLRVRTPRVKLRARHAHFDSEEERGRLIDLLAQHMQSAVQDAWRRGELQAAATP